MRSVRWLDNAYVSFARPLGCFEGGWGESVEVDLQATEPQVPAIRWRRARVHGALRILDGEMTSPEELLPLESRVARVRWIAPRDTKAPAITVALAAWGDEDFAARMRLFAPAAARGVSALLLENPFYGQRRRVGQSGARLRTVSDFLVMGRATVREAHALLAWARGETDRIGIAGYSMGGQMSAMAGALAPWPISIAAMAPAATPASVFLDGPLRRDVMFRALGDRAEDRLRALLERLSVLSLPRPRDPTRALILGAKRDAIVPPKDVIALGKHWGVSPRWIDEGHVSAIALRPRALAQAIIDAMSR